MHTRNGGGWTRTSLLTVDRSSNSRSQCLLIAFYSDFKICGCICLVSPRDSHACRLEQSAILLRARVKTHLQGPTHSVSRYKSIYKVFGLCLWLRQIGAKHWKMEHRSDVAEWMPLVSSNFWVRLLICSHLSDQSPNPVGLLSHPSVLSLRACTRDPASRAGIFCFHGPFMSFRQQRPPQLRGHSGFQ